MGQFDAFQRLDGFFIRSSRADIPEMMASWFAHSFSDEQVRFLNEVERLSKDYPRPAVFQWAGWNIPQRTKEMLEDMVVHSKTEEG